MNILEKANQIINERSEEKERQYGPISEGFERAAMIMSGMTGKNMTAEDMFAAMLALKFSRHSYNYKEDNFLDAAAYLGAWNNYIQGKRKNENS
jgi:DNA-binding protein H-NS